MIGATGMLQDVATWAAERSTRLLLVAREAARSPLSKHPQVSALSADWRHPDVFVSKIAREGGFIGTELAVLWMHGDGAETKRQVLRKLSPIDCLTVLVQGSNQPGRLRRANGETCMTGSNARSITVTLGAIQTQAGRRWLTWPEISTGVIGAIEAEESRVVGQLFRHDQKGSQRGVTER